MKQYRKANTKVMRSFALSARRLLVAVSGAVALLSVSATVHAQSNSNAWTFELSPYLWASGMKGDVQAGSLPRTSTDMSFSDIFDILDFGFMGSMEARKGRWGIFADAIYMKVSDSATVSRAGAGPFGATLSATAAATLKQTTLASALMYRVSEGASPVDLFAGLRYSKIDVEATADFTLLGLAASRSRTGDKDWVDPYLGVRIQAPIAERWKFVGYGDFGGFGVGADSTYQLSAELNYAFSKTTSFRIGYRYFKVDYDKGGFVYDMKNDGVVLGASFKF